MVNKSILFTLCLFLVLSCGSCSAGFFGYSFDEMEASVKPKHQATVCIQLVGQPDWSCTD